MYLLAGGEGVDPVPGLLKLVGNTFNYQQIVPSSAVQ